MRVRTMQGLPPGYIGVRLDSGKWAAKVADEILHERGLFVARQLGNRDAQRLDQGRPVKNRARHERTPHTSAAETGRRQRAAKRSV